MVKRRDTSSAKRKTPAALLPLNSYARIAQWQSAYVLSSAIPSLLW
jgi:hypothetical protein